jgi:hypothetical protein
VVFLDHDDILNRSIVTDGRLGRPSTFSELQIVEDAAHVSPSLERRDFLLIDGTRQRALSPSGHVVERIDAMLRPTLPLMTF